MNCSNFAGSFLFSCFERDRGGRLSLFVYVFLIFTSDCVISKIQKTDKSRLACPSSN